MRLHEPIAALHAFANTSAGDEVLVAAQSSWPVAVQLRAVRAPHGGQVWLVLGDNADDPYAVAEEVWSE